MEAENSVNETLDVVKEYFKGKTQVEKENSSVNETLGVVKDYFKGKSQVAKENAKNKNKIFCDLLYTSLSQAELHTQQDVQRQINRILVEHNLD